MKRAKPRVLGIHAPPTRPTPLAALLLATALSLPIGLVLWLVEVLF